MRLIRSALLLAATMATCAGIAAGGVPKFCMGCDFKSQHVGTADFSNGVYFGSNFEAADLSGASFRGARLIAANFDRANLSHAAFDGADCLACNFSRVKLDGATFAQVRMAATNFSQFGPGLDNGQLRNLLAGCIVCDFKGGKLMGADLAQLAIVNVDFSHADLRQVRFDGAIMCWYQGVGPKRAMGCDKLSGAQTAGASFGGIRACDDPLDPQTCKVLSEGDFRRSAGI